MTTIKKNDVAELVSFLQGLELEEAELNELVTMLVTKGLTDEACRRVRTVLMSISNRDFEEIDRYEKVLDIVRERDAAVEKITHETQQSLGRIDLKTKSTLNSLKRKVDEDVVASSAGATLLLHTEDVVPEEKTVAANPIPTMSPKQAATAVYEAAKYPVPASAVSPISAPLTPNTAHLPVDGSLPVTQAPLPSTSMVPLAVTEPGVV